MHKSLVVYKEDVLGFINADFTLQWLADDCRFTEGPVWNKDGFYLFSDITGNCIFKILESGSKEIYLSDSGTSINLDPDLKPDQTGSNGLAYDEKGHLFVCRHGSHSVGRYDGKRMEIVAEHFRGKPFNSPNDIVVHPRGNIFFSDPPYGLKDGKANPSKFQPVAGVYCIRGSEIKLVSDRYQYPNGLCFSNDQQTVFVSSNKPFERFISMYDVETFEYKGIFAEENSDGMKMDRHGNLFLCSNEGIIILDKKGERLARINLPAIPANACWGGKEGSDLLVTARENIFLLEGLSR